MSSTIDPDVWLDPLARGSLLHEVFETSSSKLIERGAVPDARGADEARLMEILDDSHRPLSRPEIPPPSEAVFRREVCTASPHGPDLPARGGRVLPRDGQPAAVHGGLDRA